VSAHAAALGVEITVRRFPATTRTAEDAAREIGCTVGEIVKSLVFLADGAPVVVLCSGADRVDEAKLKVMGEIADVTPGQTKSKTFHLKPGKYAFICNVPGHYSAGRYGGLSVK